MGAACFACVSGSQGQWFDTNPGQRGEGALEESVADVEQAGRFNGLLAKLADWMRKPGGQSSRLRAPASVTKNRNGRRFIKGGSEESSSAAAPRLVKRQGIFHFSISVSSALRWVILPAEFSASRKVFPFR